MVFSKNGREGISMSIEENKVIISRIWEDIFSEGKLELVNQFYDNSYVYHGPGKQELKGLEVLIQYKKLLRTFIPDAKFHLETVIAEGDKVAVHWSMTGTYAPTNIPLKQTGMIISRIVKGKCVEDWEVFDRLEMAEQGIRGWLQKKLLNSMIDKQKKAVPFLALSG